MSELTDRIARKHFERGRMFELQDKAEEAQDAYREACALDPQFPEPWYFLGRMLATGGRDESALSESLEMLDRALTFGEDSEIIEWRGYVNGRLRRYDDALKDYQAAIPGGAPGVRINAGRMLMALGRYDEAEQVLRESDEPAAQPLLDALPRYREFIEPVPAGSTRPPRPLRDPVEEARAMRYLFGATLVLGTLGDGGLELRLPRYLQLTYRHCAVTIGRLLRLVRERNWHFDAVGGSGPHHGPVAAALAELLEVPLVEKGAPGQRVLLAHGVLRGADEAQSLRKPWVAAGAEVVQLALGFSSRGDPSRAEPDLVGLPAQCAVEWYRVEPWSRLESDPTVTSGDFPGFRVGPAFFDSNSPRVTQALVEACRKYKNDPVAAAVLDYYRRHAQLRAFGTAGGTGEASGP